MGRACGLIDWLSEEGKEGEEGAGIVLMKLEDEEEKKKGGKKESVKRGLRWLWVIVIPRHLHDNLAVILV